MKNQSCEVKYYRLALILVISFDCILLFTFSLIGFLPHEDDVIVLLIIGSLFFGITYLPFLIYYAYRYRYYKKLVPRYIQEVKMEKVGSSFTRRVYFTLAMNINGKNKNVNTLAIFQTNIFGPNLIDDYSSKTVLAGYDEKNDVAVVLKVLN